MKLRFTMMGRSYDASAELPAELELSADARIDDALQAVARLLSQQESLSSSCLLVLNGKHLGTVGRHENAVLADEDEMVLIAPVAGG